MSTVNKIPYIESALATLTTVQLGTFKTLLNSATAHTPKSLFTSGKLITNDDKGVSRVDLELELGNIKSGILIYNDTHCDLIAYNKFLNVLIFKLNLTTRTYEKIDEECNIEELRRVLDDTIEASPGGTDAWVETMKEVMSYDSENTEVEIGTHLYVDGKIEIGDTGGTAGDLVVGHEIIIDDLQKIVDPNGDAIVPDPSGHLNEALVHTTTGYAWKKVTEMAGIQVVAKATFEPEEFVPMTNIVYIVYDTDGTCYVRYFTA